MSRITPLLLSLALLASACGDNQADGATPSAAVDSTTTGAQADTTTTAQPASNAADTSGSLDLGRLVVLGEDFLLADVLALGGRPVAATSTLGDRFSGIDRDTSAIAPLSSTEPDLERLVALEPDTIVVSRFVADAIGLDLLDSIASTTIVEFNDWRAAFRDLAADLGATERGETVLGAYDTAVADAADALTGVAVSMATIYPGPTLAVWTDGPINIPQTFLDVGIELIPGPETYPRAQGGRTYVSNEVILELTAPTLVLLQSSAVAGEDQALAGIEATPLWGGLPAVETDQVVVLDRLGYPGVEGRIRLIADITDTFGS